jgi:Fusaric acid resistance protein family
MSVARLEVSARSNANRPDTARIVHALRSAAPALLFGLRLWTAVCLALYTAFWLQLDNADWAGTSAAIVCQPSLGASLRKGWFRMVGTAVGAVAIMTLTACPQQRDSFLLGLAFWCAACGLLATLLRNFAAYAAASAGSRSGPTSMPTRRSHAVWRSAAGWSAQPDRCRPKTARCVERTSRGQQTFRNRPLCERPLCAKLRHGAFRSLVTHVSCGSRLRMVGNDV